VRYKIWDDEEEWRRAVVDGKESEKEDSDIYVFKSDENGHDILPDSNYFFNIAEKLTRIFHFISIEQLTRHSFLSRLAPST